MDSCFLYGVRQLPFRKSTTTETTHTDVTPPIHWLVRVADEMNLIDGRTAATTANYWVGCDCPFSMLDTNALQNDKDVTAAAQTHTRVPGHYYYNRLLPYSIEETHLGIRFLLASFSIAAL